MTWKHEQEATASEVEDEPDRWLEKLKENTLDLRDITAYTQWVHP